MDTPLFRRLKATKIRWAPLPGSWHFGIPVNAKNKDLAAEFIKYMSIGEGNELWLEANGDVPATIAGADKIMNDENAEEYMKIAAY